MVDWELLFSITEEEIKRLLSYKRNFIYILACIVIYLAVSINILRESVQEQVFPVTFLLQLFTKIFAYSYAVSLGILIAYGLSIDSFTSDKQNKALETILTTPPFPREPMVCKIAGAIYPKLPFDNNSLHILRVKRQPANCRLIYLHTRNYDMDFLTDDLPINLS